MELLDYLCKNCNNLSKSIIVVNNIVICPYCKIINDVWISKFSLAYLKHLIKKKKMKNNFEKVFDYLLELDQLHSNGKSFYFQLVNGNEEKSLFCFVVETSKLEKVLTEIKNLTNKIQLNYSVSKFHYSTVYLNDIDL